MVLSKRTLRRMDNIDELWNKTIQNECPCGYKNL